MSTVYKIFKTSCCEQRQRGDTCIIDNILWKSDGSNNNDIITICLSVFHSTLDDLVSAFYQQQQQQQQQPDQQHLVIAARPPRSGEQLW